MNAECLVFGIMMGCVAGGFCGLLIASTLEVKKVGRFITVFLTIVVFTLICTFGMQGELEHFNNGYCYNCGTKYEAVDRRNSETYYECPECFFGTWH